MQSREQAFAAVIHEQVKSYGDQNPLGSEARQNYGSLAHKLPVLVRTAGLAQALEFVHSRGKSPHQQLLTHLAGVVVGADAGELLRRSRAEDLRNSIFLTERTMLALKWYKRFAQSVLKVEPAEEEA